MTVIGNPLAEDLRRCCDMYEAALNELRATAKQYLAAATAYHQSPHDIAIHARYGAARSELVRVLGLEDPTGEHIDMLRELLASYGNSGFSAERAALTAAIEALEPPAQQPMTDAPSYSAWLHVLDEALVIRHIGTAEFEDDYITAQRKLHALISWEIDVATDPAVGGDRVRKQQPMTDEQILRWIPGIGWDDRVEDVLPLVRAVEQFQGIGIGKGESDE